MAMITGADAASARSTPSDASDTARWSGDAPSTSARRRAASRDTPACHSVVLPIPAAPSRSRAEGPADADPMKFLTSASSASRPRIP